MTDEKEKKEIKPWEKQPGESHMWFHRFDLYYRPLGPERTIAAAYRIWREEKDRQEGKETPEYINRSNSWNLNATKYKWIERAQEWDESLYQERIKAEEKARGEMLAEHVVLARTLWSKGAVSLEKMIKKGSQLTAEQTRHYIRDGINLERQARGLPEHLLAVADMTDEDLLSRYDELLARIGGTRERIEEEGAGTATPSV